MLKRFIAIVLTVAPYLLFSQTDSTAWPKVITAGSYIIKVYTPENVSYVDLRIKSNSAVSIKKGEEGKPTFGMIWTTAILDVDRQTRMADLVSITVDEVGFPGEVTEEKKNVFKEILESEIPKFHFEIPLDELLDSMEVVSTYDNALNNNPPKIIVKNEPSVLVIVDGEPKFKEAEKGYSVIENSAFFIVESSSPKAYYLKGGELWYKANESLGNYLPTEEIPKEVIELSKKTELEKEEEGEAEEGKSDITPKVIIATEPTELIVFEGEAKFSPIQGTKLLYVENTESNVFMDIESQNYYLLISGRWFKAKDLNGRWKYEAADSISTEFKNIPKDHEKANVLASVAGTQEAKNALYDAQIPQTAEVAKDKEAEEVKYNGEPDFEKIKGLDLEYAKNTESSVLKDGDTYFLCQDAIWYVSDSPKGPWKVSEERPEKVDEIPADNPQYNVKYVYIYETTPSVVYVGYTPGYYGSYVYGPTVVYGTGFYYNPWYAGYYYHYPYSYGFGVSYNSMYGWSFGFSFGSPYGWYGHAYWGAHYHWGPRYYRPPYYRYGRPVPYRNVYRTQNGVNRYQRPNTRPSTRPSRPSTQPTRPSTRPSRPSTQPANPSTRPSRPSTQPSNPSTRPSRPSTQPSTRPSRPSTQPSTRPSYPSSRPSTRPSYPSSRPTTRPSAPMNRPSARPMGRPGGMRR